MWLVAMSRCVVRSGCVVELEDDLVIRSTKYCKYHTVLTTRHYKILLRTPRDCKVSLRTRQYYKAVLQSTTPCYKVLQSITPYYTVLQSITPFDSPAHETPSTMREATSVTLELHQILRLPRKMILMIDPCPT